MDRAKNKILSYLEFILEESNKWSYYLENNEYIGEYKEPLNEIENLSSTQCMEILKIASIEFKLTKP